MDIPQLTAAEIIQNSQVLSNDYSKSVLVDLLEGMEPEAFNRFCREILLLTEYYDSSIGASVCDLKDFIAAHPDKFYSLKPIDPGQPVNFRIL